VHLRRLDHSLRIPYSPARLRRYLERSAALLAGAVVTLIVLELVLRAAGSLYWREDVDPAVFEGRTGRRVLCLGDSFTYGVGASANMDYPAQLQALLREDPDLSDTLVVNGGIGASNSRQALQRLGQFLEAGRIDLVVVMTGPRNSDNFQGFVEEDAPRQGPLDQLRIVRFARYVASEGIAQRAQATAGDPLAAWDSYLRWHAAHGGLGLPASERDEFLRGADLLRHALYADAEAVFQAGLERHGGGAPFCWGLSEALRGQHRLEEAEAVLKDGIEQTPDDPFLYVALSEVLNDLGTSGETGLMYMTRGLEEVADCAALHCAHASFLFGTDRFERATKGLRLDPNEAICYPEVILGAEQSGQGPPLYWLLQELAEDSAMARGHLQLLQHQDPDQVVREWLRSDLDAMVDLCESHGTAVVFQAFPHLDQREELAPSALANRCMETVAGERGLPLVNPQPAFEEYYERHGQTPGLFGDDGHPNDAGYGLMAQAVFDACRDRELLGSVEPAASP